MSLSSAKTKLNIGPIVRMVGATSNNFPGVTLSALIPLQWCPMSNLKCHSWNQIYCHLSQNRTCRIISIISQFVCFASVRARIEPEYLLPHIASWISQNRPSTFKISFEHWGCRQTMHWTDHKKSNHWFGLLQPLKINKWKKTNPWSSRF